MSFFNNSPLIPAYKIQVIKTSPYTPRANGRNERVNGLIKKALIHIDPKLEAWTSKLILVGQLYNLTPDFIGFSPYYLLFGIRRNDVLYEAILNSLGSSEIVQELRSMFHPQEPLIEPIQEAVHKRLFELQSLSLDRHRDQDQKVQLRAQRILQNNKYRTGARYLRGSWVMKRVAKKKKSDPSWDGPYLIVKVLDKFCYKIRHIDGHIIPTTVNHEQIRPAFEVLGSPIQYYLQSESTTGDKALKFMSQKLQTLNQKMENLEEKLVNEKLEELVAEQRNTLRKG